MKRRAFLGAGAVALCGAPGLLRAEGELPTRFVRPDVASDEGGLWALMDREEAKLRRSPFILRDNVMRDYIQGIACRLAGDHCPDIRVYLVRDREFNANMAPNGMMQVWSGLMLRVDNEAQLAAVLGHEIGHYLERHSLNALREAKSRSAVASFLSVFGLVGQLGALATLTGLYGHSRDNERRADEIGVQLMHRAGYDTAEAAKVWDNLLLEIKADPSHDPSKTSVLFATHPGIDERRETLNRLSASLPRGQTFEQRWLDHTVQYRREWLNEECKRGRFAESMALLNRLIARSPAVADYPFARAEVYRLRGGEADLEIALKDYQLAKGVGKEPPETHRGMGMIYRQRQQWAQARASFGQYLQLAPAASDAAIIKSYIEDMNA